MADNKPTRRISRLDAFRGIAATAVLVSHCCVVIPWSDWGGSGQFFVIRLWCWFVNAKTAVLIFFVISGYVLGLSLDQGAGRPDNFRRFYFRRVFRIFPAHVVTIGVIAIILSSFEHAVRPAQASPIFGALFPAHLSPIAGLFNALLLRAEMNGVVWTLSLEMAVSLVFPILYLASRHRSWWARGGMLVALMAMSALVGTRITFAGVALIKGAHPPGIPRALLEQFWYIPDILNNLVLYGYVFYLGLVAAPVFRTLVPRIEGRWGAWLIWLGWFLTLWHGSELTPTSFFLQVCGVTLLVFCGALMHTRSWLIRALEHPLWNRVGTVSYSFYLYHLIIVYGIATVMFRVVDPILVSAYPLLFVTALSVFSFLVTAAVATGSYYLIEVPMISYSKTARMRLGTATT